MLPAPKVTVYSFLYIQHQYPRTFFWQIKSDHGGLTPGFVELHKVISTNCVSVENFKFDIWLGKWVTHQNSSRLHGGASVEIAGLS